MTPQDLIRTILDAVAEDDLRKAEDAIAGYVAEKDFEIKQLKTTINVMHKQLDKILYTQQNKP